MGRMTSSVRVVARGLRGRGWFARLLLAAAALALLLPSLTAFEPGLAGWSPSHGHVYSDDAAVEHTHPWEAPSGGEPVPGVTFTWDDVSAVFAIAIPLVVALSLAATLLMAVEGRRPDVARPVFARIPTPPPR